MSRRPRPALIVPDELSWTMWGVDPADRGLTPASGPEEARGLLVPEVVPAPLARPLAACLGRIPARPLVIAERGPAVNGEHISDLLKHGFHPVGPVADELGHRDGHGGEQHGGHADEQAGHGDEHAHDEHGHGHDMMAIVGAPSADGLVMEPIELELGPLNWVLPGGLVASLRLDGDLVASCALRATLVAGNGNRRWPPRAADPLAPVAWATAAAVAREQATGTPVRPGIAWRRIAAVELERAVSHLAWLRSVGRVLGWAEFVNRSQQALDPVLAARRDQELEGDASLHLPSATRQAAMLATLLEGRRFATRARGRGQLDPAASLTGPNARAVGSRRDVRSTDPLYGELGFAPVVREGGDAEARVLLRAHEAIAAVWLAAEALARTSTADRRAEGIGFVSPAGAAVEGPRGPVLASASAARARALVVAPGAEATAAAAAAAATGEEWSAALLTLVSFDLSGWRVPG